MKKTETKNEQYGTALQRKQEARGRREGEGGPRQTREAGQRRQTSNLSLRCQWLMLWVPESLSLPPSLAFACPSADLEQEKQDY